MIAKLFIGDDQLDLFRTENMSVISSVANINDITKNTTDYSKDFTVPASAQNNIIFKHYYNVDVVNGYDARIKKAGHIELDGLIFKIGNWMLLKVSLTGGVPSSYTINFLGNLTSLKDDLGDDELSSLDYSAYDGASGSAQVLTGLTDELYNGDIIYNLLAKRQYFYSSDPANVDNFDTFTNIAYNGASGENGIRWDDLRASIRIAVIIDLIETKYDLKFSRHFFGRTEFNSIYMWLDSGKKNETAGTEQDLFFEPNYGNYNPATGVATFPNTSSKKWWRWRINVIPDAGFTSAPYIIKGYLNGDKSEPHYEIAGSGTLQGYILVKRGDNLEGQSYCTISWTVTSAQNFEYSGTSDIKHHRNNFNEHDYFGTMIPNEIAITYSTADNLPKMKIIDFLKGLFTTFKLVVIPEEDGTLYVNTIDSYYQEGDFFDVTEFISLGQYPVSRGDILQEIDYLFQDPTTILNGQFKINTTEGYGDYKKILKSEETDEILTGSIKEFRVPFETVVYERLRDVFADDEQTNSLTGTITNDVLEPANPKPQLFYNINVEIGAKHLAFIDDTETKNELTTSINIPSHTIQLDNGNYALIFDEEFNEWTNTIVTQTLWTNYHQTYIESLFGKLSRRYEYKADLPVSVILKLTLNDVLQIEDIYYRLDKFTLDPVTGKTTLNLVNSLAFSINNFETPYTDIGIDYKAQDYSAYISNMTQMSPSYIDTDNGTDWIVATGDEDTDSIVTFAVEENLTGDERSMQVRITNVLDPNQDVVFTITQDPLITEPQ